jgi:hypothetical protein
VDRELAKRNLSSGLLAAAVAAALFALAFLAAVLYIAS